VRHFPWHLCNENVNVNNLIFEIHQFRILSGNSNIF
jgi:hypothetical protein